MMRTIRPPESKQPTTLLVAVKCRPLTAKEESKCRDILRVSDDKVVVVLDPDVSKEYLDRVQNRSKQKRYAFDFAFGPQATNRDVYGTMISSMLAGVLQGLNATIFAYGATGSGKTYTMAGTPEDPGLMVLSLRTIFDLIAKEESMHEFEVTCSYLEVYNEVIYDLLEKSSGHLEMREDPDQGITVAGLKRIKVNSADKILELLNVGNSRRKTESTEANATSSRSHAVLEITVKRQQKNQHRPQVLRGKLSLVDLAGSERASETNNAGQKLRDGANINRSLLALANCINALGKQQKKGLAYVPYRNSKLTRILKDGLSGNSRTVMIATVSPADDQYHHTINTLKYADRAKEIKTHIQKNIGTVDSHVADYQRMIDNLQVEVCQLRKELAEKESQLSVRPAEKADDELSWLDVLSRDTNENVEERINLQKALFELEDINLHNRIELQQLDDIIAKQQVIEKDGTIVQALRGRRQVILDNIRDNDEAGANYQKEIEINEAHRSQLQQMIDEAIRNNGNKTYLRILSQYRLLGMTNTELQFQMAIRDQIIHNQREVQTNLWALLGGSGLNHKQILELAAKQGITIEDWIMPPGSPVLRKQSPVPICGRYPPFLPLPLSPTHGNSCEKSYRTSPRHPHIDFAKQQKPNNERDAQINTSPLKGMDCKALEYGRVGMRGISQPTGPFDRTSQASPTAVTNGLCTMRQEHRSTFHMVAHLHSPSALLGMRTGNFMEQRSQHWSAETHLQHCCSRNTICVDPACNNSETGGLDHHWNEDYVRTRYNAPAATQSFTEYEQLQKGHWHANNQPQDHQDEADRSTAFANCTSHDGSIVHHGAHKTKIGKVLFPPSSDRGEQYFIPNAISNANSPLLNSHHIIYNSHSTYYQNYPVFSGLQSPLPDQRARGSGSIDPACGVSKVWSDHRFGCSSTQPRHLWPRQNDGWKQ
eukprot:Gb_10693 [translate_table: standard]